jgi:hypothetical protein
MNVGYLGERMVLNFICMLHGDIKVEYLGDRMILKVVMLVTVLHYSGLRR